VKKVHIISGGQTLCGRPAPETQEPHTKGEPCKSCDYIARTESRKDEIQKEIAMERVTSIKSNR